ncbi:MAG: CotH kinase family protein [Bacteroidaceae bacterium]|nr:CotH kinase family protein [Bacteroidaceae bacterium]
MKQYINRIFTCLILGMMFATSAKAAGPALEEEYLVPIHFQAYANTAIPASAFNSDATSATIKVYGAVKCTLGVFKGTWEAASPIIQDYDAWDESKITKGLFFEISGDNLALAKQGKLSLKPQNGNEKDYKIYVINHGAGSGTNTGNTGNTGNTDNGNTGNTGNTGGNTGNTGGTTGGNTGGTTTGGNTGGTTTGGNTGGTTTGGSTSTGNTSNLTLAQKIANRQQLTNLATVYFDIPDAVGKDINTVLFKDRKNNIADYHQTTIQVVENGCNDGTDRPIGNFTDAGLEIKVRGNSTAEMDKRPYRLKFYKDEKDAAGNVIAKHKHDMLGYGYSKRNWTILNNMRDGSLMQNAITYHIGKAVGMDFCPGYKFVDLVINGEYRGNYMLSDHVELGKNRINIDEDNGWFVESTRNDMVEEPYFNAAALYVLIKNPEGDTNAETEAIKEEIKNYFVNANNNFFGIWAAGCDDATFCDPVKGWRSIYDEESLVKFYVGLELTGDSDGMMQVKMYREPTGKMHFGPLWDKDLAFGIQDDGKTLAEGNSMDFGAPTFGNYVKKIMKTDPVFVKKVHDKLHQVLDNGYIKNIMAEIDKLEASLLESKALEYNNTGWKAISVEKYPEEVERLRQYIKDHTQWFVDLIDERYEAMGGASIKEPEVSTETGDTGTTTTPTEPAFETEVVSGVTFNSWEYKSIPSTLFNSKATSATVKVKGAVYVCISTTNDETGALKKFAYSDVNKPGVTYELEGANLEMAKKGQLYIGCNPDETIVLSVINHGTADDTTDTTDPNPGEGTTDPEPDPEPVIVPVTTIQKAQLTDLPTFSITTKEVENGRAAVGDSWSVAALTVVDKNNVLGLGTSWTKATSDITSSDPELVIQYQGSGTEGSKNSYRLKFGKKIKLLPSGSFKQWVLASNDDDPSMINNALAKVLGDAVGMPYTPGYAFVDLYLNGTYLGTYQVTDRIKTESGRSLVTGGNKDNDWQIQFDDKTEIKENDNAVYINGTTTAPYIVIKNPDPDDLTAEQLNTLKSEMTTYFNDLFKKTNGHYSNVEANVDKQQLINWYICQEILCVYKGFSSIEAYRSITAAASDNLVHFGPLWDSEKAFGNVGDNRTLSMKDLNKANSYQGLMTNSAASEVMRGFFADLWTQTWFKNGVIEKWNALMADNLKQTLSTKAAQIGKTLTQSQPKNAEVWTNSLEHHTKYTNTIKAIQLYLDARFAYLDKKFKEMAK